eukprot:GHVU01188463.1.p1 GENE.GHVU01188463.1~~GHVU01188463.1.p1  ORF type:complete len:328 (+),score=35.29 GHVU01188463.1:359-1342(+)
MLAMIEYGIASRAPLDELMNIVINKHKGYTPIKCCTSKDAAEMRLVAGDWTLLSSFQQLLEPFKRSALIFQTAQYPTAGLTIPMLAAVIKEVEAVRERAPFGRPEFGTYRDLTFTEYGKVAALLDPRCRRLLGQCGVTSTEQDALLVRVWSENYGDESLREIGAAATEERRTHYFAALGVANTGVATVEEEVTKWLSEPPTTDYDSESLMGYMRGIKAVYPRIHRMARDYLCAPGTSISCESAFSRAGITTSKRRARLDDDAIRSIVELQAWKHLPVTQPVPGPASSVTPPVAAGVSSVAPPEAVSASSVAPPEAVGASSVSSSGGL